MGNLSKHFDRDEFQCRGENCSSGGGNCGTDSIDYEVVLVAEDLREHFGKSVLITSGHRCLCYNRKVGSKDTSQHIEGKAIDVVVSETKPEEVYAYLCSRYLDKYGIGLYDSFVHIDVRPVKARW